MADFIADLIAYREGTITVLPGGVGTEDGGVGLNSSCGNLRGWVNGELQLGLLAIIGQEMFHQQGGELGTSFPSKAVENQEALKICALVSQFPNSVQDRVNDLLANSVAPSGTVIGSIFLVWGEPLGVKELVADADVKFISDSGFQIYKQCPWGPAC